MKGAELPINTLVVLVLLVIVLIAVILFFYDPYRRAVGSVDLNTAKSNACTLLTQMVCSGKAQNIPVNDFDANKDGTINSGDNLLELCKNYYNIEDDSDCKQQVCQCS
jgi:hypothetical protein